MDSVERERASHVRIGEQGALGRERYVCSCAGPCPAGGGRRGQGREPTTAGPGRRRAEAAAEDDDQDDATDGESISSSSSPASLRGAACTFVLARQTLWGEGAAARGERRRAGRRRPIVQTRLKQKGERRARPRADKRSYSSSLASASSRRVSSQPPAKHTDLATSVQERWHFSKLPILPNAGSTSRVHPPAHRRRTYLQTAAAGRFIRGSRCFRIPSSKPGGGGGAQEKRD